MKCLFNLFSAFVGTMFFMPVNAAESAADYNVVPQPRSIAMQKGEAFVLSAGTKIIYPDVTLDLMEFVEQNILPRYAAFDKAHRLPHITRIIRRALELAKKIGADCNMTYVAAAYHDLGLAGPRAVHHLTSGKILGADARLRRWFTSQQIKIMKEAVEDHRASASHAPRNIYGKIIAEANRDLEPDVVFRRTVEYGLDRYPEKNKEAQWKRFVSHLENKYSTHGYVRLWIPNSPNEANLKKIREIINDKTLLRERFEQIYESAPAADPPICL